MQAEQNNGAVAHRMRAKLESVFQPVELSIVDESALHAGHAGAREGGESHFRVHIVSAVFAGLSRVQRQRRVYETLAGEIEGGIHALALTTLTPDEAAKA